jgi:nicotinamidase-related amidase
MFHAHARFAENIPILKGRFPLTENYSVFSPEVTMHWSGTHAIAAPNVEFLESLLKHDFIVVAGQALSHCVQSSVDDLLSALIAIDPVLVHKVCIIEDCMSAVVVPNVVDYTDAGAATLERYREMGVRIIRSTDPLDAIF